VIIQIHESGATYLDMLVLVQRYPNKEVAATQMLIHGVNYALADISDDTGPDLVDDPDIMDETLSQLLAEPRMEIECAVSSQLQEAINRLSIAYQRPTSATVICAFALGLGEKYITLKHSSLYRSDPTFRALVDAMPHELDEEDDFPRNQTDFNA
jgi:hypothetical protein